MASTTRLLPRILDMSVTALWAYRLRSLFVVSAIALGIASLTIIVAAVDGAQRKAVEITDNFGPNSAFVLGGDVINRPVGQRTLTLTWNDAERLRESLPGVTTVVTMRAKSGLKLKHESDNTDLGTAVGATEDYASAWNWPLAEGRDISADDVAHAAKVMLIGDQPAKDLFGDASPLGKTVLMDGVPFLIVGRLSLRGIAGGPGNPDDRVIVPLTTLTQRYNLDRKYFRALRIKFADASNMTLNKENLRSYLRHLHGLADGAPDDFTVLTADEVLKFLSMLQGSLVIFLGVTAGVAMLVGGFVLANLFHLSVSERRFEIGLKKAVGARSSAILTQFLAEAVLLTLVGALLGLGLGLAVGQTLAQLGILEIKLSPRVFAFALIAATLIGIVFGLKPARQAAALDPIQALRG